MNKQKEKMNIYEFYFEPGSHCQAAYSLQVSRQTPKMLYGQAYRLISHNGKLAHKDYETNFAIRKDENNKAIYKGYGIFVVRVEDDDYARAKKQAIELLRSNITAWINNME